MRTVTAIVCVLLVHMHLMSRTPENWFETPRSDRTVHYDIKGVLNWPKKMLEGRMTLTWRNTGSSPVQDLPFELHLNAFRHSDTSFMKANPLKNQKAGANTWGYCEISSVKYSDNELSGHIGEDETIYWIHLPRAIKPGESVQLEIAWETKFPEIQAGSGWTGRYLVASMWYPKLGLFSKNQWTCEPFRANAGHQGNFGVFDVELSLPNALQLANTGMVITPLDEADKPLTDNFGRIVEAAYDPDRKLNFIYKIHAEDVQDFSWIAAPNGSWGLKRLDFRNTQVFYYYIPKNGSQLKRLQDAIRSAMRYAEECVTPYPYPVLSVVDLPCNAFNNGHISSPTLVAISNIAFDPFQQYLVPEHMAIQQLGKQLFEWVTGSDNSDNSNEYPLRAELSSWFASKTIRRAYPGLVTSKRFYMGPSFPGWYAAWSGSSGHLKNSRCFFSRKFFDHCDKYAPTLALSQFEAILGRSVLEDVIRAHASEFSYRQSNNQDFRQIAENISKRDLESFWKNHVEIAGTLDYRLQNVTRTPDGHGVIALERLGNITAPVTVWIRLEDGQEFRQRWDGEDKQITFDFNSPISAAVLDPDWNYPSLKSRMHSTYSAVPTRRGLHYWARMVFGAIGGVLQGIGVA